MKAEKQRRIYTFPGAGILLTDRSAPRKGGRSALAYLPAFPLFPLIQHPGAMAHPVVSVGDRVKDGSLVARGQGANSANIHSSVPGKVVKTLPRKTPDGRTDNALVIRLEGAFEKLGKKEEKVFPWEGLPRRELQKIIEDHGIVDMEGGGAPLAGAFADIRAAERPVTLVISCVFDDPWLAADYTVCRERTDAVVEGAVILRRASGASRVIFAVSRREEALGEELVRAIPRGNAPVSLVLVSDTYPQSIRRELEMELRLWARDEGADTGAFFIVGPSTLTAVSDAVKHRTPLVERYVAVGGSAVKKPQVVRVRLGTRLAEVFAECGGFVHRPEFVGVGSPLSGGCETTDLDEPVTKTCSAIFALRRRPARGLFLGACIGCGECRRVCPRGLDPEAWYKRERLLWKGREIPESPAGADDLEDCIGCGCCEMACPTMLPLLASIASLKREEEWRIEKNRA